MTARLKFETRAKCQELALFQEDGILCESESPFCYAVKTFSVFQSKSLEERVIGQQFAPLWADQLKLLFVLEMTKVHLGSLFSIFAKMISDLTWPSERLRRSRQQG